MGDNPLRKLIHGPLQRDEMFVTVADIKSLEGEWDLSGLSFELPQNIRDLIFGIPSCTSSDLQDVQTWRYSPTGHFSMKIAYLLPYGWNPCQRDEGWKWIWETSTHPRIQYFLWLCTHRKIPTTENLAYWEMNINTTCAACNSQEESIEHLFRECPIAIQFWRKLGIPKSKKATFRASFSEWIRANCLGYEEHTLNIPWKFIFPQAIWLLWKQRNAGIFRKERPNQNLHEVCVQRAAEYYTLSMTPSRVCKKQTLVRWDPPPEGFYKLNTDGSILQNPGKAGAGDLIRDYHGRWILGFGRPLGVANSLMAEGWALQDGLRLARWMGIQNLYVELDAKVLYDLIWSNSSSNMHLFQIILECRQLASEFRECRTNQVYREANGAADFLAKTARDELSVGDGLKIWEHPPPGLSDILAADCQGVAYPRYVRNVCMDM